MFENKGQAGVVGFLLCLGIFVTAFSIWFATSVPVWKREGEAKSASQILGRFGELRSGASMLALRQTPGISFSVPLKLQGGDIPLLPDAIRQGVLMVDPAGSELTITRYWGEEEPIYWKTEAFEWRITNLYYTGDGTLCGPPDWYPQRVIENLFAFEVSFREYTEPGRFDLDGELPLPEDENDEGKYQYLIRNVENIDPFTLRFIKTGNPGDWGDEEKIVKFKVKDGFEWEGKFKRVGTDLMAKITAKGEPVRGCKIAGYFDNASENYQSPIDLLGGEYYLANLIAGAGGLDISYAFKGDALREYRISGMVGETEIHTDLKVKLIHEGETVWDASFKEGKNDELKIDIKDIGRFEVMGYFDNDSDNHNKNLDLLDPKYGIGNSVAGKVPYDIKFEKGNKAYGSYVVAGVCPGGMSGGPYESWTYDTGLISFDMQNNYLVNQVYTFEDGGVVLEQGDTSLMLLPPQIRIFADGDITNVLIHSFDLQGPGYSGGGSGTVGVELYFKEGVTLYESDRPETKALLIEIKTERLEAWRGFFTDSLEGAGAEEGTGFVVEEHPPDLLLVAVLGKGDGKDICLNLGRTELGIGVGTV